MMTEREYDEAAFLQWARDHKIGPYCPGVTSYSVEATLGVCRWAWQAATARAALAQPAQAVAWQYEYPSPWPNQPNYWVFSNGEERNGHKPIRSRPVYAAPQPAPATDEWRDDALARDEPSEELAQALAARSAPSTPSDAECERIAQEVSRKHPNAGDQEYAWECIRAGRATVAEDAARLDWLIAQELVPNRAAIDAARGKP